MKILVIEDDTTTRNYIAKGFTEQGHSVDTAEDGQQGLLLGLEKRYDLITLDRMLPGLDGMKVLASLRASDITTPVLILSAIGDVDERVRGLRQGGDDYMTKPFAFAELLARADLLMARGQREPEMTSTLSVDDLELNLITRDVHRSGRTIDLQPREFLLLRYLMEHAGQVVTRTLLFEEVWHYHFDPGTNVIDVHIARLRRKLEAEHESRLLHTVRGVGYTLKAS
ncbi:response regulator transcription factor [Kistimonas asteriae]|uniref:response regulator transcription factor n=1 Tax=Kistimonas asteriae TaxID=517724 RepID=UPI001BA797FB|nr:response regulator transcription factor [Kistimonas asteriae]